MTSEREEHESKQESSSISTLGGIDTDLNSEHCENAEIPIRNNFQPEPQLILQREEQTEKQTSSSR
jgi:hypothetical protein